jgi:hypothetical protein
MLNYGPVCRSQNVLSNLYLIDTKIVYKKIYIFYSDPLPDLRPDLGASGCPAFACMFGFIKFRITTGVWCLVVWSAQGLDYYIVETLMRNAYYNSEVWKKSIISYSALS